MKHFERTQCEQSLATHSFHYDYFVAAGSPKAAAVYARAIASVQHFMMTPHVIKYQPKHEYQPTKRGHYAPRKQA